MFQPDPTIVAAGIKVMAFGLAGVFTVLILFYIAIKLMGSIAVRLQKK